MVRHYPKPIIFIHWLTLLFVIAAYISSGNPLYTGVQGQIHVACGIVIFLLFFIRLGFIVYYSNRLPKNEILNKIQEVLFKTVRFLLYLCLFVVPLFGWLALSSLTDSFQLFNQNVPLFSLAKDFDFLGNIHQLLGNLFISLVGLHASAALLHHFILKDNVLKSMLFHRDK